MFATLMKYLFVLCVVLSACQEPTQPPIVLPTQISLSDLRGTWRNLSPSDPLAYCIFDTTDPTYKIKVDYGRNFRWENGLRIIVRDNQLCSAFDQQRWYWLLLSENKDTLTFSIDSPFQEPQRFVRDMNAGSLDDWMTTVYTPDYFEYNLSLQTITGLAYSDSTWFILSEFNDTARVHVIRMNPIAISSFALPSVHAIDAVDSVLWCAKPGIIEKRRIEDTTLISKVLVPFQEQILGIAVLPDKIYVDRWTGPGFTSQLVTLSLNGQVIDSDTSWYLRDLAFVNQSLYSCHANNFYRVNPSTGYALASYKFSNYLGQPNAVADFNGSLAVAFLYPNVLRIGILPAP